MADPALPDPGVNPWGEQLNAFLEWLEGRVTQLEAAPEFIYNSTPYQFNNGAPPATGSQLRLNNVNAPLATIIDIRMIDSDGADRSQWIKLLNVGSMLRITDWDNAANFHRYNVTGPATFTATNAQIPVSWDTGNGVLPNAKINVGFILDISPII